MGEQCYIAPWKKCTVIAITSIESIILWDGGGSLL